MSFEGNIGSFGLGGHAQMGDMADTGQCLAAEAVSTNGGQVLKSLELGSRETLTQDREILFL